AVEDNRACVVWRSHHARHRVIEYPMRRGTNQIMASVSGGISASMASALHPARSLHLRIILLLASLMLCMFTAHAQQHSSSDPLRNERQATVEQKPGPEKVAKAKASDSVKDEPQARSDSWLVWLTGALVLVALGQAVVFFYQWRQLKETVKATRAN